MDDRLLHQRRQHLRQQHFNFRPDERQADGRFHRRFSFRSAVPNQILAVKIQQEGMQASCVAVRQQQAEGRRTVNGERAAACARCAAPRATAQLTPSRSITKTSVLPGQPVPGTCGTVGQGRGTVSRRRPPTFMPECPSCQPG